MRLRRLMALVLSVVVLASAVPLSVMGRNVVASGGNDLDGLPIHSTKVYDGYKNIGGYTRPSAQTILNDYKNSSQTGVHPRVMISKDQVTTLKSEVKYSSNPKNWWYNKLKKRADVIYSTLTGSNKESLLFSYKKCFEDRMPGAGGSGNAADQFKDRMMVLGMAYLLTGDTKYPEAAWVMLERVITFDDINPWHDLDFGFFCQGYAIAYDWMYDAWTADQRSKLEQAIMRQCFRPANDSYTSNKISSSQTSSNGVVRGVWVDNNHNPIVNSGIAMVSFALMDKYPSITSSLCHDAFICLEFDLNMFAPDGVTNEGVEYMLLSMDNLSMLFSTLEASTGKLYGLDTCPGLAGGKVMLALHGMESDVGAFSFGDTPDGYLTYTGELYFDKHYDLHGFRKIILDRLQETYPNDYTKNVQILCWYEPDKSGQSANLSKDLVVGGDVAFATFRNNFDAGQSFVGVKAGSTLQQFFLHLDQGSFVYTALGEKWAVDMGKDKYSLDGYMENPKTSNNKRFKIFRLRPDGHNTLLIDPNPSSFGYEFNKTATLTTETSDTQAKAVIDLTSLVSSKASSDKRGFLLTDNRLSLVVRDEVTLTGTSDLYWVMYTPQNVKIEGNKAILTSKTDSSKQVTLEFSSSVSGTLYSESAKPWSLAPTISGQNPNDDYTRIVFKISGAKGSVDITAKFTPKIDATKSAPNVSTYGAISSWNVNSSSSSSGSGSPTPTGSAPSGSTPSGSTPSGSSTGNPTTKPSGSSGNPTTKPSGSNSGSNSGSSSTEPSSTESDDQIMAFVKRNYIYVLGRDPEEEGAKFWYDELYNFRTTGAQVAQGFIFSKEFEDRNTTDEEFVTILYKTFFGRDPEPDGMKFWLNELSSGISDRRKVANGFIFSQEWADTCATYGIRSGGDIKPSIEIKPTDLTYAFVERLYTTALGREYDEEGKQYWAKELSNYNITGETCGAQFFLSKEMNDYNLSDEDFLTRLYATFMNREPDDDGFNYWLGIMETGAPRSEIVYGFTRSPEFTEKCVQARIVPY